MVKKRGAAPITKGDLDGIVQSLVRLDSKIDGLRTELKDDMSNLRTELKGDMSSLRTDLNGDMSSLRTDLNGDMSSLRAELNGDMSSLRAELNGDMSSLRTALKGDIRLLMIESVGTNARMKAMEERLTAKMDAGRAEDARSRESFLGRMETLWRESAVFPKLLDEQGTSLRGHELRIAALEARPSP